jgi:hypothetical protein
MVGAEIRRPGDHTRPRRQSLGKRQEQFAKMVRASLGKAALDHALDRGANSSYSRPPWSPQRRLVRSSGAVPLAVIERVVERPGLCDRVRKRWRWGIEQCGADGRDRLPVVEADAPYAYQRVRWKPCGSDCAAAAYFFANISLQYEDNRVRACKFRGRVSI